jgi:hypothetical protein
MNNGVSSSSWGRSWGSTPGLGLGSVKDANSIWNPNDRVLVTRIGGAPGHAEVANWRESLARELSQIEDDSTFKIIVDFRGYEADDLAVHQEICVIIPITLAEYGFRTALMDLFEGANLPLRNRYGISCLAVAHVHHDENKMNEYDRRLGRPNERFFTDYRLAEDWIRSAE